MRIALHNNIDQSRLTATQKSVMHKLVSHTNKDRVCWPSTSTIAAAIGRSRRTVFRAIADLEKMGELDRAQRFSESGRKTSNLYTVSTPNVIGDGDTVSQGYMTPCHIHKEVSQYEVSNKELRGVPPLYISGEEMIEEEKKREDSSFGKRKEKREEKRSFKVEDVLTGSITPKLKSNTLLSRLFEVWKEHSLDSGVKFVYGWNGKQKKLMGLVFADFKPDVAEHLFSLVLSKWAAFTSRAEKESGAFNSPSSPNIEYLYRYRQDAINFALAAIEKKQALERAEQKEKVASTPLPVPAPQVKPVDKRHKPAYSIHEAERPTIEDDLEFFRKLRQ